jgi:hypothetical protein
LDQDGKLQDLKDAFAAGETGELRQEVKELTGRMTEMTKAELAKKWKETVLEFQN